MKPLTYRDAGVDVDAGDEAVRRIAPIAPLNVVAGERGVELMA